MRIGLTGGNGFIGSELLPVLLEDGHEVSCLIRKTSNLQWIEDFPIDYVYGNIREPESLGNFVKDKDIIFHLAGMVKGRSEDEIMEVNAQGTKNLLEAVRRFNPHLKRFLFISSQETMGLVDGESPCTEDIQPAPITAYGKSKAQAEEFCAEHMDSLPITILRPSPVYGPKDTEMFIFFKLVTLGISAFPNGDARISIIFSRNLAKGMYKAALSDRSRGQTYLIADDKTVTYCAFNQLVADDLNKKIRKLWVPKLLVHGAAGVNEFFHSLAGKTCALNRDKAKMLTHGNLAASNEKAKKEFGYTQETGLEEAIHITVDWYKKKGWLH